MTKSRRPLPAARRAGACAVPTAPARRGAARPRIDDTFFRHIVAGMRNGVLAITP